MPTNMERETGKIGLRLNHEKMKVMIIREATMFPPITIGHQTTEEVNCLTYLGSVVDNNVKLEADVNSRTGKASLTFQRLCLIQSMATISLRTNIHLYNTIIPIATYTSKT